MTAQELPMDFPIIRDRMKALVDGLLKEEKELFTLNVSERAIAHRLACRMTDVFKHEGWLVDCEYNRDGLDSRKAFDQLSYFLVRRADKIDKILEKHGAAAVAEYLANAKPISVFPDIIVHHRTLNTHEHNLLVIEIKKSNNPEDRDVDSEKLRVFTRNYTAFANNYYYQFGLFIEFTSWDTRPASGTIFAVGQWFEGGGEKNGPEELAKESF